MGCTNHLITTSIVDCVSATWDCSLHMNSLMDQLPSTPARTQGERDVVMSAPRKETIILIGIILHGL